MDSGREGVDASTEAGTQSETGAPQGAVRFKLISYNVQARPVLDDQRAAVNLPIIGGRLAGYDIGRVEECFSQCDKLFNAAPQPFHYYFDALAHPWSVANSGLAGVSRFEIEELVTTHYQHVAELADSVASKGVARMQVHVQGFAVDVYNTHMQAGDSDGAHDAQSAQADELVAFIQANSPADRTVVRHGDFNMSPARRGKRFEDFDPNHYTNEADMLKRTSNFQKIIDQAGLTDVFDAVFGPVHDHIDRVLFRAASDMHVTPLSWEDQSARFVDAEDAGLSDGMPTVVELELSRATPVTR